MKKFLTIMLVAMMAMSLVACGNKTDEDARSEDVQSNH